MRVKDIDYKKQAEVLKSVFGENPENVRLYTINESVSRSGMSAVIKVLAIVDGKQWPIHNIAYGRVHGYGLDRGFEAAYSLFMYAYPKLRYQEHLEHHWL